MSRVLAILAVGTAFGCTDPTGPGAVPVPPDVRPWVTGAAAASLDDDGHFVFPDPAPPGPDEMVDGPFAAELALAFIRTWVANPNVIRIGGGSSIRERLERDHGGPVDWSTVRPDARAAYFARTPYEPLPDSIGRDSLRRFYGPHYLVPLFEGDEQVASIWVAAYSTEVAITAEGFVDLPAVYGNEFFPGGVPGGLPFMLPLWPEEAVMFASEATGAKVAEIPVLTQLEAPKAPQGAVWQLTMDREITVLEIDSGVSRRARTVYVGVWGDPLTVRWYRAADEQPTTQTIRYATVLDHEVVEWHEIEIGIRPDVPILFVEVEPRR